jgi:hypothetical protein
MSTTVWRVLRTITGEEVDRFPVEYLNDDDDDGSGVDAAEIALHRQGLRVEPAEAANTSEQEVVDAGGEAR